MFYSPLDQIILKIIAYTVPYELASLLLYRNLSLLIQMHACHRDTYKIKIKKCLGTVFFMVLRNDCGEQVHHKSTTECYLQS